MSQSQRALLVAAAPNAACRTARAAQRLVSGKRACAAGARGGLRAAVQQGTLGFGFSAGGFLYCYHLGVLWELTERGVLPPPSSTGGVKLAGASAGALAIATYACGLDVSRSTTALLEFAADCRTHGTRGRLSALLREFLHTYLPDDAHERCRDVTHVHMTRVLPTLRPEVVSRFSDKADLVEALITSCHIPLYANGEVMTSFRGRWYVDGGLGAFIPRPPTPSAVKVSCVPVSQLLARMKPGTAAMGASVADLLDVAISPDAFEPEWAYTLQQLLAWALVPADDDTLRYLIRKGRTDAAAWAAAQARTQGGQNGGVGPVS